jgi:hypothetical protein
LGFSGRLKNDPRFSPPPWEIKEITVKNNDIQRTNSIIYYSALNLVDKKRCKHEIVKPPSAS